ncbi:MAG: prepilin-type N-terminal cleavage/methylation domain-containing protein [Candidatus Saccharibacteria bacterium]
MNILKSKKEQGFTLLELLIVIVIIGILALLIIPNISSAPKKARDTQRKTDLRAAQKALEEYYVSNQAYPTVASPTDITTALTSLSTGSAPPLKTIPVDPKNVSPYTYLYTSTDGQTYTLTACLENGADSTTGTVAAVSPCATKSFQLQQNN